jgi:hypothetical protein
LGGTAPTLADDLEQGLCKIVNKATVKLTFVEDGQAVSGFYSK